MAAGKPCIYRGDEFRDRDYHFSRRDYHYSGNEYDRHYREGESRHGREFGRWKEHGGRDGYNKHRQKDDGRKREERVDWRYSSLSRGKSGRESGEISSGSGSDGSVDYALEAIMPPRKKLKISPIVADREEKEENRKLKDAVVPIGSSLPIVAKYCHQSPKAPSPNEVQNFPKSNELTRSHEHSPTVNLPGGSSFVSPRGLSSSLDQEWNGSNDRETEQLGEFEQNLQVSRWADDDEDEILDEEMHRRGKDMPVSGSSANSSSSKSPESGEFTRGSSLGSESHVNELFKNDYVEVDKNDENKITLSDSDIDLDEEDDDLEIPELKGSQRDIDMLYGSRSVHEFERLNYVNHGTYGDVYRARDKRNGEVVALKKVKMEKEREGFPLTSLREINILMSLSHSAIVDVKEVVVEEDVKRGKSETYLVMEYMEHDLKGLMETMKHPFSQSEVKCLMLQLLEGVKYLHDNWVLHRDLKTSNLLFNNCGELKICDFGLSRQYGSPLKPYTPLVVTLWYRAPELLLGAKQYSTAIDMWSVGCIMAELIAKKPLFCGESELDQLNKIFGTLGTPSEADWPEFSKLPGWKIKFVRQKYNLLRQKFPPTSFTGSPFLSAAGLDLLNRLLSFDPEKRITAEDAVNHEWFREVPLPKAKEFMPTFPVQHAKARRSRLRRIMKNPDPLKEL